MCHGRAASKAGTELNDPDKVDDELDPFRNKDEVSLESAYGTSPQWWTYDNGCTGQFVAGAGTSIGNIMLEISGILPNWSHALLNAVIGENSFLKALDDPIVAASKAVTDGVWAPWVSVVLLLVAATVMIRARDGRFARAVTAAGWALGVRVKSTRPSMTGMWPATIQPGRDGEGLPGSRGRPPGIVRGPVSSVGAPAGLAPHGFRRAILNIWHMDGLCAIFLRY